MKICLIGRYNYTEKLSGPEKFANRLFINLYNNNFDTIFIEYFFKNYINSNIFNRIFGYYKRSATLPIYRLGIFQVVRTILKTKPDIIHIVNFERYILILLFLKKFIDAKIVITTHGLIKHERSKTAHEGIINRYFIDITFEKYILSLADEQIFVSKILLELTHNYYGNSVKRTAIIRNGVDKIYNRKEFSIDYGSKIKIVYYLGDPNFIDRGFSFLLDSFKQMKYKGYEVYIIGEKIKIDKPWNKFFFSLSPMDSGELVEFLADKHFILKSNTFDSFPIFVIECMSMGLIPIVSDLTGTKEIIINSKNGFVYNANEQKKFIKLIEEIMCNKFNLLEISLESSKTSQKLDWDLMTKKYVLEYNKLLNINN